MKFIALIALFFSLSLAPHALAADAGVPVVVVSPLAVASPTPQPAPSQVAVSAPAAPPQWAQDLMVTAEKLPVIGPILDKALLYLGIIGSILTMLVAFLLGILTVLENAFSWSGLMTAAAAVGNFKNGKIMYWIQFFSMFNAKKPDPL